MTNTLKIVVVLLLSCMGQAAYAIGVRASADRTVVGMGEEVVLTVTVSGVTNVAPKFPDLREFDVRNGGQSSQFSMMNGTTTSEKSFTFFLRPRRVGTASVGAFTIEVGGKLYASEPFELRVNKERPAPARQDSLAYIEVSLSNEAPVVGEPVIWTFRLLHRVQVSNVSLEIDEFDGLAVSNIGEQKNYRTTIAGVDWEVIELQKRLVPEREGVIALPTPQMPLDLLIPDKTQRRRGLFASMGGFKRKNVQLKADDLVLSVAQIPTPPDNFSGLVGQFSMRSDLSKTALRVGEATTLTMHVRSVQPMLAIPSPIGEQVQDVKTYESADPVLNNGRVFRVDMVPQVSGEIVLPVYELVTYDSVKRQYQTYTAGPYRILVDAAEGDDALNLASSGELSSRKDRVQILADDILPLRDLGAIRSRKTVSPQVVLSGMALPPLMFFAFSVYVHRKERLLRDTGWARRRVAFSKAKHTLSPQMPLTEQAHVLRTAIGDLFNIEGGALTADEVGLLLVDVPVSVKNTVVDALRAFELAQYADNAAATPDQARLLSIIRELEEATLK